MSRLRWALVLPLSWSMAALVPAQDQSRESLLREIEALRKEQAAMQERFEARLKALEKALASKEKTPAPVKWSVLLQNRFEAGDGMASGFSTRRLELKFSGTVGDAMGWTVMFDPSKSLRLLNNKSGGVVTDSQVDQRTRMLQDAFLTYRLGDGWSVDVGQKKVPFSHEALTATATQDQTERSMLNSNLKFGDVRELGVQVHKSLGDWTLTGAILNGVGETANGRDGDSAKVFGARVVVRPKSAAGLQLGTSILAGGADGNRRQRLGVESVFQRGPLTLHGELASGFDGDSRSFAGFAAARLDLRNGWEVAARFDRMNTELSSFAIGNETQWVLGAIYHLDPDALVQGSFTRRQFPGSSRDFFVVQFQTRF